MNILVVDGQGGGIGRSITEGLVARFGHDVVITAVGTNPKATQAMRKGGAHFASTGEPALKNACSKAQIIVGTIGILAADALMGEMTPTMAMAVAQSPAYKILIPLNKCNIWVAGTCQGNLGDLISDAIQMVEKIIASKTA